VIGMGERKTPNPFIVACDKFIFIEILETEPESAETAGKKDTTRSKKLLHTVDKKTIGLISTTIEDLADEDGWAFLGDVGNLIIKKRPEFDPRNYGFSKLTPMLKSLKKYYEIDERDAEGKRIKHVYIRLRK